MWIRVDETNRTGAEVIISRQGFQLIPQKSVAVAMEFAYQHSRGQVRPNLRISWFASLSTVHYGVVNDPYSSHL